MKRPLALAIASTLASIVLLSSPATFAMEARHYPGVGCIDVYASGQAKFDYRGYIYNDSTSVGIYVACPFSFNEASGGGDVQVDFYVDDQSSTANVQCWVSTAYDGGSSYDLETVLSTGTGYQVIAAQAVIPDSYAAASVQCYLPPKSGNPSRLFSYGVTKY